MKVSEAEQGIIPRVIEDMYRNIHQRRQQEEGPLCLSTYHVSVQFLEIYGEEIKDLLDPVASSKVVIREVPGGGICAVGATEELAESAEEMMLLLERGSMCRTTGSTLMNTQSSRSHAIFTILLEHRLTRKPPPALSGVGGSVVSGEGEEEGSAGENTNTNTKSSSSSSSSSVGETVEVRTSKFHFVDLAGSERAKRTGAQGKRLKEGIDINKGLLVLGNVISALGDAKKKGQHVPYRDSKLTRMLQDSLGGNSQTLMIACVSPAEINMMESLNALRYANRARNIENKPVLNRDKDSLLLDELRHQVEVLAAEVLRLKGGGGGGGGGGKGNAAAAISDLLAQTAREVGGQELRNETTEALLRQRCEMAETEMKRLGGENRRWRQEVSEAADALLSMTADRDYYRPSLQEVGVLPASSSSSSSSSSTAFSFSPSSPSSSSEAKVIITTTVAAAAAAGKPSSLIHENKETFTTFLKPYLAEIDNLKSQVKELEQSKARRERRQTEENLATATTASMLSVMAKSFRGVDFQALAKMVGVGEGQQQQEGGGNPENDQQQQQKQLESEEEQVVRLATEEEAGLFYRGQQEMASSVADLNRGIDLKEKLMKQLEESFKRYEIMRKFYEEKLRAMTEETARYEAEREKLLHELAASEKKSGKDKDQKEKELQQSLLRRIQEKEEQLQAAVKKQDELGRLARQAQKTDLQLRQLGEEIQSMKRHRSEMMNRIEAEKKRFQATLKEKSAEIEAMRRAAQKDAKEIQRLGTVVEKAGMARRKQEEEFSRLKNAAESMSGGEGGGGGGGFGGGGGSTPYFSSMRMHGAPSKRWAPASTHTTRSTRSSSSSSGGSSSKSSAGFADWYKYSEIERKTKRWLDIKIREVAKKEEAAERLAAEYQRRMTLLKTKEELELARSRLHQNRRSVRDVISMPLMPSSTSSPSLDTLTSTTSTAAAATVAVAFALDDEEEATLEELEERIEACKAQLEYKEDKIKKIETIIDAHHQAAAAAAAAGGEGGREGGSSVRVQVANSCQTLEQSHGVIRMLFDMLVSSRRDAKGFGDRLIEMDYACHRMHELLEEAQGRVQAEKRFFEERLTRVTLEYEEKISGLIDNAELSGLLLGRVLGDAVTSSSLLTTPGTGESVGGKQQEEGKEGGEEGDGQQQEGEEGARLEAEQYKCMLRLSNERNQALKLQMQQIQSIRDDLLQRGADLEAREKRAREELRDCQGQVKWLEFELTKIRGEYIKMRGDRNSPPSSSSSSLLPCTTFTTTTTSSSSPAAATAAAAAAGVVRAEQLRQLEEELLGGGWGDENEEEEGEEDIHPVVEAGGKEGGEGGKASVRDGISALDRFIINREEQEEGGEEGGKKYKVVGGEGEEEEEETDDAAWAQDIAQDIHFHIKEGNAPPSIMARESVKRALYLSSPAPTDSSSSSSSSVVIVASAAIAGATSAGGSEATSPGGGRSSIFERLADPQYFTGIHKHGNEGEAKERRQKAEKIRVGERDRYMHSSGSTNIPHKPIKGGSLAASMYKMHVPAKARVEGSSSSSNSSSSSSDGGGGEGTRNATIERHHAEGEASARAVMVEVAAFEVGEDGMSKPLEREGVAHIPLPSFLSAAAGSSIDDKQQLQKHQEQQEQQVVQPQVASEGGLVFTPDLAAAAGGATAAASPSAASPMLPTASSPTTKTKKKSLGEQLRSMFKKKKKKEKAENMASSK